MTVLYTYQVDANNLSLYSKELDRNNFEITPIDRLDDLGPQDFLFIGLQAIQLEMKLPNATVVVYSHKSATEQQLEVLLNLCQRESIFGLLNTDLAPLFYRPFFNRYADISRQRQNIMRLATLGQELDQLTEQTRQEMMHIKKLHEQIVPVRNETHKGLKIHSKYSAGGSGGGEFFDFHHQQGEFLFILSSSTSYLMTSAIINRLEYLRSTSLNPKSVTELLEGILEDAQSLELKNRGKRNGLDLLLVHVDLKTMNLSGYQFGKTLIIGDHASSNQIPVDLPRNSQFIDKARFNFPLKRGERLLFLSAGVTYNCQGLMEGEDLESFWRKKLNLASKDLLNELFFQLKKDLQGEFLDYDASAISIEVDQNAIFQI